MPETNAPTAPNLNGGPSAAAPPNLNGGPGAAAPDIDPLAFLTPEQLARHERRLDANDRAAATPLPGPLIHAFAPGPVRWCGLTLREMVPTDFTILQRLGSPIITEFAQLRKTPEERTPVEYADEDVWELLYLFTRDARLARAALAQGRPQFREAALSFVDSLGVKAAIQRAKLLEAVAELLVRAFSTALEHAPADTTPSNGSFPSPPAPQPMTASAGGSN